MTQCSVESLAIGEPLPGTAPRAKAWLVLEQSGSYGFDALSDSQLPAEIRLALAAAGKETGTTVVLARPVGKHADDISTGHRRFWLSHCAPGGSRMRTGVIPDSELTRPDLKEILIAAAQGELPPWGHKSSEPLLLVCTHAKRDVCCALAGRPLAQALAEDPETRDSVMEVSHLGGHRFAPNILLLPTGHVYGRIDADSAKAVLLGARRGKLLHPEFLRGRSSAASPGQVAAVAVRRQFGVDSLDTIDVLRRVGDRLVPFPLRWEGEQGRADLEVRHLDGRAWSVSVVSSQLAERRESCGKEPAPAVIWTVDRLDELPVWR